MLASASELLEQVFHFTVKVGEDSLDFINAPLKPDFLCPKSLRRPEAPFRSLVAFISTSVAEGGGPCTLVCTRP